MVACPLFFLAISHCLFPVTVYLKYFKQQTNRRKAQVISSSLSLPKPTMNYPRRQASRSKSSDSLAPADLRGPQRRNSSDLSLYGESSRDLLEFSRYVDEKGAVEKESHPKTPGISKSLQSKQSVFGASIGSSSFPKVRSSPLRGLQAAGSPYCPASMDGESEPLKTPPSDEMTNTQPFGDISVPPFLEEKCKPHSISHRSHRNDFSHCSGASLKPWLKSLQLSPAKWKKTSPSISQRPSTRTVSESVTLQRSPTPAPPQGSVRGTRSFDDSYSSRPQGLVQETSGFDDSFISKPPGSVQGTRSFDNSYSSRSNSASPRRRGTHFLQWDRAMVQVVPGYSLPLAGLQESIAAYQRQAIEETICEVCQTELFCIDSASMVLCPVCRSFSPICTNAAAAGTNEIGSSQSSSKQLGLGLTAELLADELGSL